MNLKKWLIFFPWLYFHLILAENLNDDNFSCDWIPSVSEESESSLEDKKDFKSFCFFKTSLNIDLCNFKL